MPAAPGRGGLRILAELAPAAIRATHAGANFDLVLPTVVVEEDAVDVRGLSIDREGVARLLDRLLESRKVDEVQNLECKNTKI